MAVSPARAGIATRTEDTFVPWLDDVRGGLRREPFWIARLGMADRQCRKLKADSYPFLAAGYLAVSAPRRRVVRRSIPLPISIGATVARMSERSLALAIVPKRLPHLPDDVNYLYDKARIEQNHEPMSSERNPRIEATVRKPALEPACFFFERNDHD